MIRAFLKTVSISELSTLKVKSQVSRITFFGDKMVGSRSYLCVPKLVERILSVMGRTVSTF